MVNLIVYFVCSNTSLEQIAPKVEYSTSLKHIIWRKINKLCVLVSHSDHNVF